MQSFFLGIHFHIMGFKHLGQPGIRRYVFMPVVLNVLFFIALFFVLRHYLQDVNYWFAAHLPAWAYWFGTLLWLLVIIGFIVIFVFAFLTLANIMAAPFNGLLYSHVAMQLNHRQAPAQTIWQLCLEVPRMIKRQLLVLGYYLPRLGVLIILFFVPIVQIIFTPLWFLFNAWMLSLTYLDYPADNHRRPFADVLDFVSNNRLIALGFGSSVLVFSMVPIVNFFTMPAAVIGATIMWHEQQAKSA